MDWENIREFLTTYQGAYVAGAGGALVALGMGYLSGRSSSKAKATRQNYELDKGRLALEGSRIELDREKLQVEKLRADGDPVELKKLDYANQARMGEDSRKLKELEARLSTEEAERERRIELESSDRSRKFQLEDGERAYSLKQAERQHRMEIVTKIAEAARPVIEAYREAIKSYSSVNDNGEVIEPEVLKQRETYRIELVDKFVTALADRKDKDDNDLDIADNDFDISDDDNARIGRIVDAKYPYRSNPSTNEPEMPEELKKLLDILDELESE